MADVSECQRLPPSDTRAEGQVRPRSEVLELFQVWTGFETSQTKTQQLQVGVSGVGQEGGAEPPLTPTFGSSSEGTLGLKDGAQVEQRDTPM